MSDQFWAKITIGGDIPESLVENLLANINEQFWVTYEKIEDLIEDDKITLEDPQARYGEFEELEAFCGSKGIDYLRESSPYGEFSACASWVIKGNSGELVLDNDGNYPICNLFSIASMVEAVSELNEDPEKAPLFINEKGYKKEIAKDLIKHGPIDKFERFKKLFKENHPGPYDLPNVPPLKIIKGK